MESNATLSYLKGVRGLHATRDHPLQLRRGSRGVLVCEDDAAACGCQHRRWKQLIGLGGMHHLSVDHERRGSAFVWDGAAGSEKGGSSG